ncbi:MAG: TIGR04283 family arsenosugar biosynthesis glycosyltransferase [Thermodesulfovibrionia bacterium]|nr:MAG: TIGR04283 family arsenosugar biosynthesis glycosyltransferase [Thermodesulfovibrionia bacterium]
MPVLNEAKILRKTLDLLHLSNNEELIVVDGGSIDETISIAREFTDKVFTAETGRAYVMNFGAEKAEGDILLFLHADCVLPDEGFRIMREVIKDDKVSAGAFDLSIADLNPRFRLIEFGANLRSRVTSIPYGDQGIFMRKEVFKRIGGYADIPLMEDIEISKRLKKTGKIVFVRPPIKASPRRWLEEGALYTTLRDWVNALTYSFFRISPERLKKFYKDVR